MPQVTRQDIDATSSIVTIIVPKEEYAQKFKKEMQKFQAKATIKGFRPGKVPMQMVEKMYGKSILADLVDNIVRDELVEHLKTSDRQVLGQPLPALGQPPMSFDIKNLNDFEFKFDVGFQPYMDLQGINAADTYTYYQINVEESLIDKEVARIRTENGEQLPTTETIEENDLLALSAKELDAEGNIKEGGFEVARFTVAVKDLADEPLKQAILTQKVGDSFRHNVYELDANTKAELVHKYILNVDATVAATIGTDFEYVITEVTRVQPAEMTEEFFAKVSKGAFTDEAGMRAEIAKSYQEYYDGETDDFLYWQIEEHLHTANEIPLPDALLKRWMLVNDEKLKVKTLEEEYPKLANSLRNEILKGELKKQFNAEVTEAELRNSFAQGILQYFGGQVPPQYLDGFIDKMMKEEKEVNETYRKLLNKKLVAALKETVTLSVQSVSVEEYQSLTKAFAAGLQTKYNPELALQAQAEPEAMLVEG